jgi:hypothetical protein
MELAVKAEMYLIEAAPSTVHQKRDLVEHVGRERPAEIGRRD